MAILYLAVDGDDVGNHLEYLLLTNNITSLTEFSDQYQRAMDWFLDTIVETFDASIIFSGGDNCLLSLPKEKFSVQGLEAIRARFAEQSHRTLSMGIGHNAREAHFALKLAKASGKNRLRRYEDLNDG